MRGLTRSNIAYNLDISPHICEVEYPNCKIEFVFSSELYKSNFEKRMQEHRQRVNHSLSNRFGVNTEFNILADLKLYTTIEKRGFLLYRNGVEVRWVKDIILDGESLTLIN